MTNILRHLEKVHNIPKHEVVEDVLPFPYRVSFLQMTLKEMKTTCWNIPMKMEICGATWNGVLALTPLPCKYLGVEKDGRE